MSHSNAPRIIAADRLDGHVFIEFEDGQSGVFSSELLYATLPQAEPVRELEPELEGDVKRAHPDFAKTS